MTGEVEILRAQVVDLPDIRRLQQEAYLSEARLLNNYAIPPLTQTLEDIRDEFSRGVILKAVTPEQGIIGSVRGFAKDGTVHIGKLMVRPDFQGKGIGARLLAAMEAAYPHSRYELFTSDKSATNIRIYEKAGYAVFDERQAAPDLRFVYLEKAGE